MQSTNLFVALALPLLGELLLMVSATTFDSMDANRERDLFWANLMSHPKSNGFQPYQYSPERVSLPTYYSHSFPSKTSSHSQSQKLENNKSVSKQTSLPQRNNLGLDSLFSEAPINANYEKTAAIPSNFYASDDYASPSSYGSHKRANLLKLATKQLEGLAGSRKIIL
uniref:Uncharacterized protein n=1 Tax=Ditylenchus dipsaci TaxID=166011 RepID=A0A915E8N1_9BILA